MTTSVVSATVQNSSTATLNTWIEMVCNAIFTVCGATQTADTGQIWSPNTATATLPGAANTSAGYVIGRFNDTLQSTNPVFFKLEFGSGSAVADPQMWITLGTGSNGSGTLNGTVTTRVACGGGSTASTSTLTSYFCYNTTYGTLVASVGNGYSVGVGYSLAGSFYISRGSNATGGPNSDVVFCVAGITATASSINGLQSISYGASLVYPTTLSNSQYFGTNGNPLFNAEWVTDQSSTPLMVPVFYMAPKVTIPNTIIVITVASTSVGSTLSGTMLGSTPITYLNIGSFGSAGGSPYGSTVYGYAVVWE